MKKFFMLTRGRTGSSAILDELGTAKNIFPLQELFADLSTGIARETLTQYPQSAPPLDVWKEIFLDTGGQTCSDFFKVPQQNLDVPDKLFRSLFRVFGRRAPFFLKNNWMPGRMLEKFIVRRYLSYIEAMAAESHKKGFVFKVLSNHLVERKTLLSVLKEYGYGAIFLVRKNIVRQALSSLIAETRSLAAGQNMYFKRNHVGEHALCAIDLDEFERRVEWLKGCVDEDRSLLEENGIHYLEVSYEDFCDDREKFYSEIFAFMGIKFELPKRTNLSIMIPDIRNAVTNFKELESKVSMMGMKGSL